MKRNDTYVSAVEPEPVRPETPVGAAQIRLAPQTTETVLAVWRNNAGMGIGVFSVLVSGFFIVQIIGGKAGIWRNVWSDLDGTLTWLAFSALAGVQAFGWLMIWRSNLDERRMQGELNEAADAVRDRDEYIDELEAKVAELRSRLDNALLELQHEQAQARATMAQARQYVPNVSISDEPIDQRTYDDAVILTERSTRNLDYSRDKVCTDLGWTTTRWYAARDLLVSCGNWQRTGKKTEVLVSNTDVALRNLAIHVGMP